MKKLLVLISLFSVFSCENEVKPIEKYRNKKIVVIGSPETYQQSNIKIVRCKNKDSIFYIIITDFDAKNLKIGDTL